MENIAVDMDIRGKVYLMEEKKNQPENLDMSTNFFGLENKTKKNEQQ